MSRPEPWWDPATHPGHAAMLRRHPPRRRVEVNVQTSVFPRYLAILLGLVLTWMVPTLSVVGATFAALADQHALVGLTITVAAWLAACCGHYVSTGDPSPVVPTAP